MTVIEWPKNSGRTASYSPAERRYIASFFRQAEQGEISKAECVRQVLTMHDLKVEFRLDLIADDIRLPIQPPLVPQEPLSDPREDTPGKFHAAPHQTEKAAAYRAMPRTGTQRGLILDAFVAAGDTGLIDEEIAELDGVADTAHRTRRNELVLGGWVIDSGRTRLTDSRTESIIWVLSERAKSELQPA